MKSVEKNSTDGELGSEINEKRIETDFGDDQSLSIKIPASVS